MDDTSRIPDPKPAGSLARDVAVLVLVGLALGVTHNAYMLAAGPGRGLPWIKTERRVVKLEDLAPADPAMAEDAAAVANEPARTDEPAAGGARTAPPHAPAPAAAAGARDTAATAASGKPTKAPGTPAQGAGAPQGTNGAAGATPPPATAPAVVAPAIPESREPIEGGLAIVRRLYEAKAALFLDARSPEEFAQGHIAGATNLPFDDVFRDPAVLEKLEDKGRPVVTYCGGGDCDLSRNLAFSIIDAGRRRVLVFTGGLPEWQQAGLPVATGAQP